MSNQPNCLFDRTNRKCLKLASKLYLAQKLTLKITHSEDLFVVITFFCIGTFINKSLVYSPLYSPVLVLVVGRYRR